MLGLRIEVSFFRESLHGIDMSIPLVLYFIDLAKSLVQDLPKPTVETVRKLDKPGFRVESNIAKEGV